MNHTLLGLITGDFSGREAMDSAADEPPDTNWCAGGCVSWKETELGRDRYAQLAERMAGLCF
jgi:hypothetical protein